MRCSAPKRWLLLCAPLILTACATMGPPLPPSLDLPKAPSDLRAARKGDRVTLTWTLPALTTDRQTIRSLGPTLICRGSGPLKDCENPIGQTASQATPAAPPPSKQKPEGTYTDRLTESMQTDAPGAFATYAVVVLNKEGRGAGLSNQVEISLAHTLPPPQDFQARLTAQGIALSWIGNAPPAAEPGVHYVYRVYRSVQGSEDRMLVAQMPVRELQEFSTTDTTFEWEKTYEYRAETVTVIDAPPAQVEGEDTPTVKVFADDVFPPAVPTGLQAVFSGPGQKPFIDLIWAPVTDADLAGYSVYRHEEGAAPVKLNRELVRTPAYRDSSVEPGKRYWYSVSSVDLRGNESARSEEANEAVP
ncbi:MAG TPA: hypothetical protein VGS27_05835 [Candidatus Sulfotelmatobacter sp.]|nr:hypothetical protein [Candidatus Sulfotelmatobacter sp.]